MWADIIKYIILFGILHSSIYMVFSLGFSLIFGVAKIPHLAYGALFTMSAYLSYIFLTSLGLNPWISMVVAVLVVALLNLIIGDVIVKPSLKMPVSVFISTFAVAYIVEEVFRIELGLTPITLPSLSGVTIIWGVPVNNQWFLVLLISIFMSAFLLAFLRYTTTGKATRAVAESWEESMIIGIDPLKVFRITMFLSGVYAATAGILLSPLKAVTPEMGWGPLFTAFAIIILGGMGSIKGTIIASLIYGFVEQGITWTLGGAFAEIAPLILIIVTLIVRPTGLFGEEGRT